MSRLYSPLLHIYRGAVKQPSPKDRIHAVSLATLTNIELCRCHINHAADRSPFILYMMFTTDKLIFSVVDEEKLFLAVLPVTTIAVLLRSAYSSLVKL